MRLRFDEKRLRRLRHADAPARLMVPLECTVAIIDDRGKVHMGVVRESCQADWRIPHSEQIP